MHRCSLAILATIVWFGIVVASQSPVRLLSVFHINGKKPVHAVSERFLSFTVEPEVLLHVADCPDANASLNLIRSLVPAYLRIAGPDSNKILFQNLQDKTALSDAANSQTRKNRNMLVTGAQWLKFNEFINKTGMNVIVSLNGGILDRNSNLDLSNALEFITFSNKNNLNLDWQLGFELQRIANDDGKSTGHDVARLRKVLEVFPRYQNSLILGPDMTSIENREDIAFVRNYLLEAQNSLNAFTLHPDFSSLKENDDVYEMLSEIFAKMDNYLWIKEGILKTVSKGVAPRKPVWIAESESKESICKFSETMSLVKRLGSAAKLGASVYLRKPHLLSLYEPTSEYWVSVMYKALVGKTVLDMRLTGGNSTKVYAFSHCTQIQAKPEEGIINPAVAYDRGSVTVYGVNTGYEPSRVSLRIGLKSEETVHLYALTENENNGMPITMLNKQPLGLSPDKELPMLSPKIRESTKYVLVPPRSVFFVVLPQVKSRACMSQSAEDGLDGLKIKTKLPYQLEEEEVLDESSLNSNVPEVFEDDTDEGATYVSYPKRGERIHPSALRGNGEKAKPESGMTPKNPNSRMNTKYITYSEDTWMSTFPDKLKEIFREQTRSNEDHRNPTSKKEAKAAKLDKYKLLTRAMLGKHPSNVTIITSEQENVSAAQPEEFADPTEKTDSRFRRSVPEILEMESVPVIQLDTIDLSGAQEFRENRPSEQNTLDATPWVAVDLNEVRPIEYVPSTRISLESVPLTVSSFENTNLDPFTPQVVTSAIVQKAESISGRNSPIIMLTDDNTETRERRSADYIADNLEVLRPSLEGSDLKVEETSKKDEERSEELEQGTRNSALASITPELPKDSKLEELIELLDSDATKIRANREASIGQSNGDNLANNPEMKRLSNSAHPVSPFPRKKSVRKPKVAKVKKDASMADSNPVENGVPQDSAVESSRSGSKLVDTKLDASDENTQSTSASTSGLIVTSSTVASSETKNTFEKQRESEIISEHRTATESKPVIEETKSDAGLMLTKVTPHPNIIQKPLSTFIKHQNPTGSSNEEDNETNVLIPPSDENAKSDGLNSNSRVALSFNPAFRAKNARKDKKITQKLNPLPVKPTSLSISKHSSIPTVKPKPLYAIKPSTGRSGKSASELIDITKARIKEIQDIERAKIDKLKEEISNRAATKDRNISTPRNEREEIGRSAKSASELIEITRARVKELLDIERAKIDKLKEEISNRAAMKDRNAPASRNKREAGDTAVDSGAQQVMHSEKTDPRSSISDSVISSPSSHHENPSTAAISTTQNPVTTRTTRSSRSHRARMRRPTLPRSADKRSKTIAVSTTPRTLKRVERDLADDAGKKVKEVYNSLSKDAKEIYNDVSTDVKHTLSPFANWLEKNFESITSELTRNKRDISTFKQRVKERRENMQKQIEELRKKRAELRAKLAEDRRRRHSRPVRDVQHHATLPVNPRPRHVPIRRAEKAKNLNQDQEDRNRRVIFRLNLLKNHTVPKDLRKPTSKFSKLHSLHKRDTGGRFKKSLFNNEIFDENEVDYRARSATKFEADKEDLLKRKNETDRQQNFSKLESEGLHEHVNKSEDADVKFSKTGDQHSLDVFLPEVDRNDIDVVSDGDYPAYETLSSIVSTTIPTPVDVQTCNSDSVFSYFWCRCKNLLLYMYSWFTM